MTRPPTLCLGLPNKRNSLEERLISFIYGGIPFCIIAVSLVVATVLALNVYRQHQPRVAEWQRQERSYQHNQTLCYQPRRCEAAWSLPSPLENVELSDETRRERSRAIDEAMARCEARRQNACDEMFSRGLYKGLGGNEDVPNAVMYVQYAAALIVMGLGFALSLVARDRLRPLDLRIRTLRSGRFLRMLRKREVRFALYFRPFYADALLNDIEFELSAACAADHLRLIVIGDEDNDIFKSQRRGVRLERLGSAWQAVVEQLAGLADRIYFLPSARTGTAWEIDLVLSTVSLRGKTLMAVPNLSRPMTGDFHEGIRQLGRYGVQVNRTDRDEFKHL